MKPRQWLEFLTLGAFWGGSFLFMRIAAPEFGAVTLVVVRVGLGALLLLPLALWHGQGAALREHWPGIAAVGLINSALPFLAFSFAALSLNAGLSAIFNSMAPLWAAFIAWSVWHERPTRRQMWGLGLGFAGVLGLAGHKAGLHADGKAWAIALAVLACVLATACYGLSANLMRRRLAAVPPLAVAAGSQVAAFLACLPLMLLPSAWPSTMPGARAWAAALALGALCTAAAYVLFFRLIAQLGPARAITVTYLIPLFGVAFGALLLNEAVTGAMLAGGALIVLGTVLSNRR